MHNTQIDQARIFLYNILSLLLVEEHTKNSVTDIVKALEILKQNSFDEDVTEAVKNILANISNNSNDQIYKEYEQLFLVPFGEFVPLSASWYYEQREAGVMLLKVKDIIAKTKVRKDESTFRAPEDHYGFIFTLCAYMIEKQINGELDKDIQKELFTTIINPYCDLIAQKLIDTKTPIYSHVGIILDNFCNFERIYLDIQRPKEVKKKF